MAVDDDVDMLLKGHIRRDAPEGSRRLSDKQLAWIDRFIAEGKLEKRFNKTFFTVGDSREPEQAGSNTMKSGRQYQLLPGLLRFAGITDGKECFIEAFLQLAFSDEPVNPGQLLV